MSNILIIDDEVQLCKALSLAITRMGHSADTAHFLSQGMEMAGRGDYDVVILDIRLPDGNGLDALPRIRECPGHPEVIILSGYTDPDGAELAIRSGAWSYIPKPPTLSRIKLPVERALEYHREKRTRPQPVCLDRQGIIGSSRVMTSCLEAVARAAGNDANVLINGETGTGKELVARAIHANSRRADGPFVVVDCAALAESLVESTLFGHEKGAFTGADRRNTGLVTQANGGTLFLDEVGEMPISVQKSFLRVLQEHRFRTVGGSTEKSSDFRLVAATHRDLESMVASWKFRQDLLFRIRTITIDVPPLRDRGEDLTELTEHLIKNLGAPLGLPPKTCSPEFVKALGDHTWPGNVRELINVLESALTRAGDSPVLFPAHLPVRIRVRLARQELDRDRNDSADDLCIHRSPSDLPRFKDYKARVLNELELAYLTDLLRLSRGDIGTACTISGLSRPRVYALLKKHSLNPGKIVRTEKKD
jgi:DNA-binding NtrC family response regulator